MATETEKNPYGYLFLFQKTYFCILFSYSIPNQIIFVRSKVTDNIRLSFIIFKSNLCYYPLLYNFTNDTPVSEET